MARTESRTRCSIWLDEDFHKLTVGAQRMYWMLYSQPTITLTGLVALTLRKWASYAVNETVESVTSAIQELAAHDYVLVDWDREELLVRTFARHDGVARSPKTLQAARGQLAMISSPVLRAAAETELDRAADLNTQSDTEPDGVADGVSDTEPDGVADRTRTRAPADSSLQSPSPSPDSSLLSPVSALGTSCEPADRGDAQEGDDGVGAQTGSTDDKLAQFANRLFFACVTTEANAVERRLEALAVVGWALDNVAPHVLDEAITWAERLDRPLELPRGICKTVRAKAADHGHHFDDFVARPLVRLRRA